MKLSRLSRKSGYILTFFLIMMAVSPVIFLAHPAGANGTVYTSPATNIGLNSATLNGGLFTDGIDPIEVNFQYGEVGTLWGDCSLTPVQLKDAGETFSQDVSGLSPNTAYQFRAKADVPGPETIYYGATETFTTAEVAPSEGDDYSYIWPEVITIGSLNITDSSATVTGNLTLLGTAEYYKHPSNQVRVYFKYGTRYYQTVYPLWAGGNVTAYQVFKVPGEFSANITNLNPGTTYYFRAMAYGDGIARGVVKTFTTPLK